MKLKLTPYVVNVGRFRRIGVCILLVSGTQIAFKIATCIELTSCSRGFVRQDDEKFYVRPSKILTVLPSSTLILFPLLLHTQFEKYTPDSMSIISKNRNKTTVYPDFRMKKR